MNKVTTVYAIILLSTIGLLSSNAQDIQRVRIDFESPSGYLRPLLLAFTPDNAASDDIDYGYDALCQDDLPEDLNWMINEQRYVIQGVGEFEVNKTYPFGMFLENSGNIEISLNSLENFEIPINVYIYDALENSFEQINNSSFSINVSSGDYLNRFFITFQNNNVPDGAGDFNALSTNDNNIDKLAIKSLLNSKEILVDTRNSLKINKIEILDILGKKVANIKNIDTSSVRIPAQHINSKIIIISVFTNNGIIRKKLLLN